jgi:hypothetical protein
MSAPRLVARSHARKVAIAAAREDCGFLRDDQWDAVLAAAEYKVLRETAIMLAATVEAFLADRVSDRLAVRCALDRRKAVIRRTRGYL